MANNNEDRKRQEQERQKAEDAKKDSQRADKAKLSDAEGTWYSYPEPEDEKGNTKRN